MGTAGMATVAKRTPTVLRERPAAGQCQPAPSVLPALSLDLMAEVKGRGSVSREGSVLGAILASASSPARGGDLLRRRPPPGPLWLHPHQ